MNNPNQGGWRPPREPGAGGPRYQNPNVYNYRPKQPDEYTYVSGLGFAPSSPQSSERRLIRRYASGLGLSILLFLFLSNIVPGILMTIVVQVLSLFRFQSFALRTMLPGILIEVVTGISYVISLVVPFTLFRVSMRVPMKTAVPLRVPNGKFAVCGVFIGLAVAAVGSFGSVLIRNVCALFGFVPYSPDFSAPTGTVAIVLFFINSAILPALCEEYAFRGVMMQSLRRFGDGFALLVSSALFSVAHLNLVQAPSAFLAGLVIGYFVLRTGSIWSGVFIHFANNAVAVVANYATQYASYETQVVVIYGIYGLYIIGGAIALMVLLRTDGDLFALKPSTTALSEKGKCKAFFSAGGMVVALLVVLMFASRYFVRI